MTTPGTWRGGVDRYNSCTKEVKEYFSHFPSLAENYPWDVSISYLFCLVGLAQNANRGQVLHLSSVERKQSFWIRYIAGAEPCVELHVM